MFSDKEEVETEKKDKKVKPKKVRQHIEEGI